MKQPLVLQGPVGTTSNYRLTTDSGIVLSPWKNSPGIYLSPTVPVDYSTYGNLSSLLIVTGKTATNDVKMYIAGTDQFPQANTWREVFPTNVISIYKATNQALTANNTNWALDFATVTGVSQLTSSFINTGVGPTDIDANPYYNACYFQVPFTGVYDMVATAARPSTAAITTHELWFWIDNAPYQMGISRYDSYSATVYITVQLTDVLYAGQIVQVVTKYAGATNLTISGGSTNCNWNIKCLAQIGS